jgi:hypothetical protein
MDTAEVQQLFSIVDSRIESVQTAVESVAEEVASLSKVLIVGNGQPPLTVRVALVESYARDTRKAVDDLIARIDQRQTTRDAKNWQLWLLTISTIATLIITVIGIFLKHP